MRRDIDLPCRKLKKNECVVSPVSKRYMRAGIGNDRLVVHVHDSIGVSSKRWPWDRECVMFVLLTIEGALVGLVLVFAATRSEMALRSAFL